MRGLAHAQAQAENWLRFLVRLPAAARFPSLSLSRAASKHRHGRHYALICVACFAALHSATHCTRRYTG